MPIKIPNELPAVRVLEEENIFVMTQSRAVEQDIRPLKILVLNLMPTKIDTETQLSRVLGNTPLQVELELIHTRTHVSKNTPEEHLLAFYRTFDDIKDNNYDGMVITGAPVEKLAFEEVEYWDELREIMDWSVSHVYSTLHICWGAQAGLYHHYRIQKQLLPEKLSGIYTHKVDYKRSILFRGFDDVFYAPHSRNTTVLREDIEANPALRILASSEDAGVYVVSARHGRQIFITGHPEYDPDTLRREYLRDSAISEDTKVPKNYFPQDDPSRDPVVLWRSAANLLFTNWLNYFVYQTTPYDLSRIGKDAE